MNTLHLDLSIFGSLLKQVLRGGSYPPVLHGAEVRFLHMSD